MQIFCPIFLKIGVTSSIFQSSGTLFSYIDGLNMSGVFCCLRYFTGHGNKLSGLDDLFVSSLSMCLFFHLVITCCAPITTRDVIPFGGLGISGMFSACSTWNTDVKFLMMGLGSGVSGPVLFIGDQYFFFSFCHYSHVWEKEWRGWYWFRVMFVFHNTIFCLEWGFGRLWDCYDVVHWLRPCYFLSLNNNSFSWSLLPSWSLRSSTEDQRHHIFTSISLVGCCCPLLFQFILEFVPRDVECVAMRLCWPQAAGVEV